MSNVGCYVGSELTLFSQAVNWKRYLRGQIAPFIQGRVLEVGAGIGGTTRFLLSHNRLHWTCLEPDPSLAGQIMQVVKDSAPECVCPPEVVVGTISDLPAASRYDTILYIDVLEHIKNDAIELQEAVRLLAERGHLIIVVPAHQWLFSPFDKAIGHHHRYAPTALRALTPQGLILVRLRYLDSVGLLASLANRLLIQSPIPSFRQVMTWDRLMVPLSRILDMMLGYRVGKSLFAVWHRPASND